MQALELDSARMHALGIHKTHCCCQTDTQNRGAGPHTCKTDLRARAAVATTEAVKPARLKDGSAPVAMTMPTITGSNAA